jgi:hypothetical protein
MVVIMVRRRVAVPVIAALVIGGLAVLGDRDPGGWVVINQALDHWTFAGGAVGVLLIIALSGLRVRTWWGRGPVIIVGVALTLLTVGWVMLSNVLPLHMRDQQQIVAPGGHQYRLVIAHGSDLESVWTLAIRTGNGITAREWLFGCLTVDDGDSPISAAWDGPTRVVVMLDQDEPRRVVVPIDPATGRPGETAGPLDGCSN